ncbi:hypothetical protein Tco_1241308, partial [Tanacetum coccineum]
MRGCGMVVVVGSCDNGGWQRWLRDGDDDEEVDLWCVEMVVGVAVVAAETGRKSARKIWGHRIFREEEGV